MSLLSLLKDYVYTTTFPKDAAVNYHAGGHAEPKEGIVLGHRSGRVVVEWLRGGSAAVEPRSLTLIAR